MYTSGIGLGLNPEGWYPRGLSVDIHRDLLLVLVQLRELAQQVDERALAEGVGDGGVEGDGGRLAREQLQPGSGHARRDQIALVQHEDLNRGTRRSVKYIMSIYVYIYTHTHIYRESSFNQGAVTRVGTRSHLFSTTT